MSTLTAADLHCPPLYATPRSPDRPTLGPNVAKIAARLGRPLLPHQRLIADVAGEINPDTGYLAYDEVDVIINRQQGKSELSFPVMVHRCTGFHRQLSEWIRQELGWQVVEPGAQRVLYTAQRAEDARQKWRDIHVKRLEESPFGPRLDIRKRLAAEQIRWPNGSTWSPGSATKKSGGTGDTIDLAFIDEAWSQKDSGTELSMRPAMLTRRWRQLWVMSMIPGLSRALPGTWPYLHQKRQNGRARVAAGVRRGVAYFEWGAAEGADPGDPATWWSCMPALGHTVSEDAIRSDFEAMPLVDFCAEYLGWEPSPDAGGWQVMGEATWSALQVPAIRDQYLDPVAFGVETLPDQSMTSIGMAAKDVNGDTFVELVERHRRPGLSWAVDALVELAQTHSTCAIGVGAHGQAAAIIEPLRRALLDANVDVPVKVGQSMVRAFQGPALSKACSQFFAETGEVGEPNDPMSTPRRIRHIGQQELTDSVKRASWYTYGDERRFSRLDADALYSVVLARAAGEDVEWIGGAYDIADSLGWSES